MKLSRKFLTKEVLTEPHHEKNQQLAYAITKTKHSFAITAKLISAFDFVTRILQYLFFQNPKSLTVQASLCWICLETPEVSRRGSFIDLNEDSIFGNKFFLNSFSVKVPQKLGFYKH